jgi:hypothetical protein
MIKYMAYYDQPQFGLPMDQLTLKTCELKPRLHNSIKYLAVSCA